MCRSVYEVHTMLYIHTYNTCRSRHGAERDDTTNYCKTRKSRGATIVFSIDKGFRVQSEKVYRLRDKLVYRLSDVSHMALGFGPRQSSRSVSPSAGVEFRGPRRSNTLIEEMPSRRKTKRFSEGLFIVGGVYV